MKASLFLVIGAIVGLGAGFVTLQRTPTQAAVQVVQSPAPASPAPTQHIDPSAQLIMDFIADRDSNNEEAAAALFTDDAFFVLNNPVGDCNYHTPCFGRAAILKGIQTIDSAQPNRCSKVFGTEVAGSIVIGRIDVRHDGLRRRGIERIYLSFLAQVKDGQILSFYVRPDLDDAQTALNQATQGQPAGTPLPGHCA